jgi:hypothetical protein
MTLLVGLGRAGCANCQRPHDRTAGVAGSQAAPPAPPQQRRPRPTQHPANGSACAASRNLSAPHWPVPAARNRCFHQPYAREGEGKG